MVRDRKCSSQTLLLLAALIEHRQTWRHGYDLSSETQLKSGTLYPILMRLEEHRWVESEWEAGNPSELGRPRRRLYSITGLGERNAKKEFAHVKSLIGRAAWGTS